MTAAVVVWLGIAIGANYLTGGERHISDPVAAMLAGVFLLASFVIWSGALHHYQFNQTLSGSRRKAWGIVVWGFFVFGALAYYVSHMRAIREAAA